MAFNLVPSGTILPFGGPNAPSGWLLCNGLSVSQTAYPALYDVVGVLWGNPGGGSFNVPNLVGAFTRGIGTSGVHVGPSGVGVVQTHATAKNALANAASSLSSGSATGSGDHAHGATTTGTGSHDHDLNNGGGGVALTGDTSFAVASGGSATVASGFGGSLINLDRTSTSGSTHSHGISASGTHTHPVTGTCDAQTISSTDTETRPNSKGVNYIIKI